MSYKPGDITKGVVGAGVDAAKGVRRKAFEEIGKHTNWWELPLPAQLAALSAFREDLREFNLYDTEEPLNGVQVLDDPPPYRTYDGSHTDPANPNMGKSGMRFGRNVPIEATYPDEQSMLDPSPREVSNALFNRDSFKPATSLNILAACWIQFQNHDWFSHGDNSETEFIEVPLGDGDDWGEPMRVRRTAPDSTNAGGELPPTYVNKVTPWWDLSQVYGSTEERNRQLRTGEDGKLIIEEGRLPEETDTALGGIDLTGFSDNYWVGLSMLHTLFANEHNAICDMLKEHNSGWDDEKLFLTARLINSALSAKIHTVEWTPGILNCTALQIGMNANWYGVMPHWAKKYGHIGDSELISGIVGSPLDHHSAPYSITSEFVTVYRLHPLIPDDFTVLSHATGEKIDEIDLTPIQGHGTREWTAKHSWSDWLYSFGIGNPGAITLHNHPDALRNLTRVNGDRLDIGTIDVLRDRERGVPRYNDFREKLRKRRIEKFEDLTPNAEWNEQIREVYSGDIDRVDLQVGMLGEPLPPGFGFSDTAFRIFILMASRRLKSDRFFTDDYKPEVYTTQGLKWIDQNLMGDVIRRHHPELAPALEGVENAFGPWKSV
ncbi:MAG: hypothetical protein QOF76_3100 [Solirubrobacteraceae bacterium]|nr:hypothetical protein [Solirubrobacteraceae bacterium]